MKFQTLIFKCRHHSPERLAKLTRCLSILLENPGLTPTAFAHKMWPHLQGNKRAGQQGSSYLRRLWKKGYVNIRFRRDVPPPFTEYKPVMGYFLTNDGFETVNILTGRERAKEKAQVEDRDCR
jgi:hypothetical protein